MAFADSFHTTNSQYSRVATNSGLLARLSQQVELWRRRARERQLLAQLSERDIADLGTTRVQLEYEINKAFWER